MTRPYRDPLAAEPANPYHFVDDDAKRHAKPSIFITATNSADHSVTISVSGVRYEYFFMTQGEMDTLEYLFKISALKALNYAKGHSEKMEKVG